MLLLLLLQVDLKEGAVWLIFNHFNAYIFDQTYGGRVKTTHLLNKWLFSSLIYFDNKCCVDNFSLLAQCLW